MKPRERLLQELLPMESATVPLSWGALDCIRSSSMPSMYLWIFGQKLQKTHVICVTFLAFLWFLTIAHVSKVSSSSSSQISVHFLVFPVAQLIVTALPISGELNQAGPIDNASSLVNMWHDGMIVCHVRRKTFQPECEANKNKLNTKSISINQYQSMATNNYHQYWSISIKKASSILININQKTPKSALKMIKSTSLSIYISIWKWKKNRI